MHPVLYIKVESALKSKSKCFKSMQIQKNEVGMAPGSTKRGAALTFHYQQRKDR